MASAGGTSRRRWQSLRSREQYLDALAVIINDQERAGMDIVSDGDIRTDAQAGGRGWFFYLIDRLSGYTETADDSNTLWKKSHGEGSIFAEIIEAYQPPIFTGKVGLKIPLRYADIWKLAQERATRPVKFDGIASVNIASMCWDRHYKDKADMTADVSKKIVNREYRELVAAFKKIPNRRAARPLHSRRPKVDEGPDTGGEGLLQ